jgi:hypothetical protein
LGPFRGNRFARSRALHRIPALGILIVLLGYACIRLGRYLDNTSFGVCGEAFAADILIRFIAAGLSVVGALRIVRPR